MAEISVIIPTYNRAAYISDAVESVLAQTYPDYEIIVVDDGSNDNTVEIIQEFAKADKRIIPVDSATGNIGPCRSFNILANHAASLRADYLMFADQDDFWQPWKIANTLELLLDAEKTLPANTPVLVHTDLQVVDSQLNSLSNSYLARQHMYNAGNRALNVLLSQNYITGCTVMANKHLMSLAQPIPEPAIMHDWWYGLCASVAGKILFIEKPTIKYRQHPDNVYGSSGFINMLLSGRNLMSYINRKKSNYLNSFYQDTALRDRLIERRCDSTRNFSLLDHYCTYHRVSGVTRVLQSIKLNVRQQGILRTTLFYFFLLMLNPSKKK